MARILGSLALLAMLVQGPAQWSYPPTKTGDATDTYFGKSYADPFRWLEDLKSKPNPEDMQGTFSRQFMLRK